MISLGIWGVVVGLIGGMAGRGWRRDRRCIALMLGGWALLLSLQLGAIAPASAQEANAAAAQTAPVLLNRTPVILVSGTNGFTAEERANIIAQRLQDFVDNQGQSGVSPDIQIGEINGSPTLELDGQELLTVTEADVASGEVDAATLAETWESQLETQLRLTIEEQSPDFWKQRGITALGIVGLTIAFHLGLTLLLRGLRQWLGRKLTGDELEPEESPRLLNVAFRIIKSLLLSLLWLASVSYVAELFPLTRRISYDLRQQTLNALTAPMIPIGEGYSIVQFALLVGVLVALVIGAGALTELLKSRFLNVLGLERGVQEAIATVFKYCFIVISAIVLLQLGGIDLSSLTILASALGVGIGFGFQDIAKNFGSGLVLVFERPIQVGDFVEVGDYSGTIERLGARSTMIRTLDNLDIFIPNSRFLEEEVTNWSHNRTPTRLKVPVGVAYGSDLKAVEEALIEAANGNKNVLKIPEPAVFFMGFGDSSLDFSLMVWIARPQQHVRIKSELNFKIDAAFRRRGIEIPFPQRDLHVRSGQLPVALLPAESAAVAPPPEIAPSPGQSATTEE